LERETGIEPATFSLGMWLSIENKEHGVHLDLVLAIENTGFSKALFYRNQIEQKWSRQVSESAGDHQLMGKASGKDGADAGISSAWMTFQ